MSCSNERWEMLTHSDESFYNVAINIKIFFDQMTSLQRQMVLNTGL